MVDDGSVFLGQRTGGVTFLDVRQKHRDKIAASDWEFLDALPSTMSSLESLDLLSALEVSKFYLVIGNVILRSEGHTQFRKKLHLLGQKLQNM